MIKVLDEDYAQTSNHTEVSWTNLRDFDEVPFELAPRLEVMPIPILKLESNRPPTDYFTAGSLKIVSHKFRRELAKSHAEFEFFPVDLRSKENEHDTANPFYFGHLLKEIDCFDFEHSVFEFDADRPGVVYPIHTLVIREDAVRGIPVFRIKNVNFPYWFFSDEFAQHLQNAGLTGMVFRELKDAIPK